MTITSSSNSAASRGTRAIEYARKTPRILVIEDDPRCSIVIQDYLRSSGFEVRGVRDGVWALHVAERDRPDVILLDLGLPGMHGYEVLHQLQRRASNAQVMVITGTTDPDWATLAQAMGAVRTLHKPVSLRTLAAAVESLLEA